MDTLANRISLRIRRSDNNKAASKACVGRELNCPRSPKDTFEKGEAISEKIVPNSEFFASFRSPSGPGPEKLKQCSLNTALKAAGAVLGSTWESTILYFHGPFSQKRVDKIDLNAPLQTTKLGYKYKGENEKGNTVYPGKKVVYLDQQERETYRLFLRNGKFYDAQGKLFDTTGSKTEFSKGDGNSAIMVVDSEGRWYASKHHKEGEFHHSSFVSGERVAFAGEISVKDGFLQVLTNRSGHYRPPARMMTQILAHLQYQGIEISSVKKVDWEEQIA